MPSLVDRFCPNVHDAPITAASFDPDSGTLATADASGLVAVKRAGEGSPMLTFRMGASVAGALHVMRGGTHVAAGDETGTVIVVRTDTGDATFREEREGERGRARAMRGVALSPDGSKLAAIARDGLLRVWTLASGERNAWQGFGGTSIEFDKRGQRILTIDDKGQPRLMDLVQIKALYMDRLAVPAEHVRFNADCTMVVAAGSSGIALLRVSDGAMVTSFATRGGSGIVALLLSPDGSRAAAVTQRSIHTFALPTLEPGESQKHTAQQPTGAAVWTGTGIRVAGNDGFLHGSKGTQASAGPVTAVGGVGAYRAVAHGSTVYVWRGNKRLASIDTGARLRQVHVDREGRLLVAVPEEGGLQVYDCQNGRKAFEGGPETKGALQVAVGGTVVAALLKGGGCRWWDLGNNRAFELTWPTGLALSNGGTWLGVITPKGHVRILDPSSGKDAMAAPTPLADSKIVQIAFVNRKPELLVVDEEGVLGHYDLAHATTSKEPATGRDVLSIHVRVDQVWGITGGHLCALRMPDDQGASVMFVDLQSGQAAHEVSGLSQRVCVDPEHGVLLDPARSGAVVERDRDGKEVRVLRSLPEDQWVCFNWNGILEASPSAGEQL